MPIGLSVDGCPAGGNRVYCGRSTRCVDAIQRGNDERSSRPVERVRRSRDGRSVCRTIMSDKAHGAAVAKTNSLRFSGVLSA